MRRWGGGAVGRWDGRTVGSRAVGWRSSGAVGRLGGEAVGQWGGEVSSDEVIMRYLAVGTPPTDLTQRPSSFVLFEGRQLYCKIGTRRSTAPVVGGVYSGRSGRQPPASCIVVMVIDWCGKHKGLYLTTVAFTAVVLVEVVNAEVSEFASTNPALLLAATEQRDHFFFIPHGRNRMHHNLSRRDRPRTVAMRRWRRRWRWWM